MKIRVNQWPNFFGALAAGFIVVGFCLLLLWHDPLVFWNDDYELSILPVFADVARSWGEGHWPLLSPYSWVCSNLAGEFQYGTFSIFINAAVILIWKFPLTFPQQAAALSITHLFVLAIGAFLLARDRSLSTPLSIFVALVAALNGWMICWGATDWFGALAAFTWLPWSWWGMERALDPRRGRWRFLWPAPFVYLLVAGGFPYTILMLLLLVVWRACRAVGPSRTGISGGGSIKLAAANPSVGGSLGETKSVTTILPMLFGVALGFGIAAPAWLAISDYVRGSARELQPAISHWQWIVPWRALPGLILPCWTVNWADFSTRHLPHTATELACGIVPVPVLLAGFIWRGRILIRRLKWELILLALVLLLSMVPTFGFFRWSFRWLPFFHLVLAICAAETLRNNSAQDRQICGLVALLIVGLTATTMSIVHFGGAYAFPLTLILLIITAVWAVSEFVLRNDLVRAWTVAGITFGALLATYFCIPPNCGVPKYNFSQELTRPAPLDPNRLYLAVYSPAEYAYRREYRNGPVGEVSRPGSTPIWAGLRFINGYSPILAAGVAREFKFFIHGEIDEAVGPRLVENESNPGGLLERIGIDGIVIAREIAVEPPSSDWQLEFSSDEGRVFYRRGDPLPTVRSVAAIDSIPDREFALATISRISDSRNEVAVDVDVPTGEQAALLTFSRPYFRGYEALLGSQNVRVESYRGLFPMVEVPAGSHGRLILHYRPDWLMYGGAIALVSGAIFLFGCLVSLKAPLSQQA